MLKLIASAVFVCSLAAAGAATAQPGQCYTADGRPTGPAFDRAAPDREWIKFVIARGGTCSGAGEEAATASPRFTEHEAPNHRHLVRNPETQRD